jgi:hypothetical protein
MALFAPRVRQSGEHRAVFLFSGNGKNLVISPTTIDVNETFFDALKSEAKLFHNAQAGGILGPDVNLDSVQT